MYFFTTVTTVKHCDTIVKFAFVKDNCLLKRYYASKNHITFYLSNILRINIHKNT